MKSSSLLAWLALLLALLRSSAAIQCFIDGKIINCNMVPVFGQCCVRMSGKPQACGFATAEEAQAQMQRLDPSKPASLTLAKMFSCEDGPKCNSFSDGKICTCDTDNCNERPCPEECNDKPLAPDAGISCLVETEGGRSEKTAPCGHFASFGMGQCCLRGGMSPDWKKSCGYASTAAALSSHLFPKPLTPAEASAHSCEGGPQCNWTPDGKGSWVKTCTCHTNNCNDEPCPEECGPKPGAAQEPKPGTRGAGQELKAGPGLLLLLLALLRLS